ncbi:nucleotidyltransferase domain-containing protein [Aestuariimicrobium sp. T2.26MG-19.2B]|uniref:nucleotidyltransferase domain-containing protein n=1 Tax=Aestuariimicrobium sp. T2.26MG-19.2B TaxID=3040679 RepID=UPI0024778FAA|nr:nucleotidyltransferase domain-containing protein [Aestuariimicrobium sp. T2.26MG-19.2B]CAI9406403.1 hypothetical protein AESSP_01619 [Aestuariimicrobium sp. T2.26MG-19.2B]
MISSDCITSMAQQIGEVPGVVGVTVGGSRARGDAVEGSDVDLGIVHDGTLDRERLNALVAQWSSTEAAVGEPGSWGPWVDSGAWLTVDDSPVDWIVRDLTRIDLAWQRAEQGAGTFHPQPGHPFGFWEPSYCGELALALVMKDTEGELVARQQRFASLPPALRETMVNRLWEADFDVDLAAKGVRRDDRVFVSLTCAHALLICAHAIHAVDDRWATNEKGLVAAAAGLPHAPTDLASRASAVLAHADLSAIVTSCRELVQDTRRALEN